MKEALRGFFINSQMSYLSAFKALDIDLSKYTESEEPHIQLMDLPDNPYDSVEKDKK